MFNRAEYTVTNLPAWPIEARYEGLTSHVKAEIFTVIDADADV